MSYRYHILYFYTNFKNSNLQGTDPYTVEYIQQETRSSISCQLFYWSWALLFWRARREHENWWLPRSRLLVITANCIRYRVNYKFNLWPATNALRSHGHSQSVYPFRPRNVSIKISRPIPSECSLRFGGTAAGQHSVYRSPIRSLHPRINPRTVYPQRQRFIRVEAGAEEMITEPYGVTVHKNLNKQQNRHRKETRSIPLHGWLGHTRDWHLNGLSTKPTLSMIIRMREMYLWRLKRPNANGRLRWCIFSFWATVALRFCLPQVTKC